MSNENTISNGDVLSPAISEQWAIVQLMGHEETAGIVSDYAGFIRVDIPRPDGSFYSRLVSRPAIFSIDFVSEDIARAAAPSMPGVLLGYDAPVVMRHEHERQIGQLRQERNDLQRQVHELERRLTSIENN